MKCNRLERLVRNWYSQVQEEALAPARMITFMEQHLAECAVCIEDTGVRLEVAKIKELVMPPAKVQAAAGKRDEDGEPEETEEVEEAEGEEDEIEEVYADDDEIEDDDFDDED